MVGEVEGEGAGTVEDVVEVGLGDTEEAGEGAFGEGAGANGGADFVQEGLAQGVE